MPGLQHGFFQLGYVTTDLDAALAVYRDRFAAPRFWVFDNAAARPDDPYPNRVGLAWIGETMVELIQPIREAAPLYAPAMPAKGIRLHHLGYLVGDQARWDEVMAALEAENMAILRHGKAGESLEYVYADAVEHLGHHLEYVWTKSGQPDFFADVPRN